MFEMKLSPKFQVVIPREIREKLDLKPGEMIQLIPYENRIEFIPLRSIASMRGVLKGMDSKIEREPDRL